MVSGVLPTRNLGMVSRLRLSIQRASNTSRARSRRRRIPRKLAVQMSCLFPAADSFVSTVCSNADQFPTLKQAVRFRQFPAFENAQIAPRVFGTLPALNNPGSTRKENEKSIGHGDVGRPGVRLCSLSYRVLGKSRIQGDSGRRRKQNAVKRTRFAKLSLRPSSSTA